MAERCVRHDARARLPPIAEVSHVARCPTAFSRGAPSTYLANSLRSCSYPLAPQLRAGPPVGPFPPAYKVDWPGTTAQAAACQHWTWGRGGMPGGRRSASSRQMPARARGAPSAERSHVARLPTTCARASPGNNLASHLRSGALPAGAPRPRRQTMCFWGRRAPAAPVRCCTQTSCGRRRQ